jgi:hypothetical protein
LRAQCTLANRLLAIDGREYLGGSCKRAFATGSVKFGAWRPFSRDSREGAMNSTLTDTDSTDATEVGGSSLLMAKLSIRHHGRYYHFDGYRYERLADAIAYAQLVRARPLQRADRPAFMELDAIEAPNADDRQLMLELSISFENGSFEFEGFHYDRLIDAANYARHRQQLGLRLPAGIQPGAT